MIERDVVSQAMVSLKSGINIACDVIAYDI